jgi:hypothetical protein
MNDQYTRPYVPGQVTPKGFIVVCVPGMKPVAAADDLAMKITALVIAKNYEAARVMLRWFSGDDLEMQ